MPKIKGWKRRPEREKRIDHVKLSWINDNVPVQRTINIEKFDGTPYMVQYSEQRKPLKKTDSLEDARKYAVRWMKSHPRATGVPKGV